MHYKGLESIYRTFYNSLFTFHQIQHVHTVIGMMRNRLGEPVTMRLDKLIRVQSRAFFSLAITLRHLRKAISQMLIHIFRITFPVYHILSPFYINRTRLSIQSQTLPIPKFKSEQVRS